MVSEADPPEGGKSKGKQLVKGVPNWALALGAGLAVGIVYIIWKGKKNPGDTPPTKTPGADANYGTPNGSTIVPIDQGMQAMQMDELLKGIADLKGPPARPIYRHRRKHHRHDRQCDETDNDNCPDDDDHDDDEESEAQKEWEREGKDPAEGPDPHPDGPFLPDWQYGMYSHDQGDQDEGGHHHRAGGDEDQGHRSGGRHHAHDGG